MTEKQCHKCFTQNPDDAIYCKQCGANIHNPFITKKVESSEILLIVGLSLVLFSTFFWLTIPRLVNGWWEVFSILMVLMSLFAAVGNVLIAAAIKGNAAKIIFIILAVILGIWTIGSAFTNYIL